jgi:electron-transferring-flavoprotein dehydrogenase
VFEGGKRLSYGARAITEGGFQSVPKLSFSGGALIGCSAGLVNVPRIKGSHNAVLSGILAADKIAEAIAAGRANDEPVEIENSWRSSLIGKDLKRVRNIKPLWSKFGTIAGVALGGLDMWTNQLFGFSIFGTLKHGKTDAQSLEPAAKHAKIDYPKPDGVLTFDRLSSVFLSNTNHDENEPVHLQVRDMELQKASEHDVFAGPSTRYCPRAFMSGWMPTATLLPIRRQRTCGSSSTRRTACTARRATSRTRTRTSTGFRHKAAKGLFT